MAEGLREGESATAFTAALEKLGRRVPGTIGAIFTAGDGECVDYWCASDPFKLKLMGAHASLLLQFLAGSRLAPFGLLGVSARRTTLWIRPLGERYVLTLALDHRTWSPGIEEAIEQAVAEISTEAALA